MEAIKLRLNNYVLREGEIVTVLSLQKDRIEIERPSLGFRLCHCSVIEPIPLTEDWLIAFEFEDWGWKTSNEYEKYRRWVLHNVMDGTSNLEVHEIHSTYGGIEHKEFVISVDDDERMNNFDLEFVHTFQNITYLLLGYDLELNR